MSWTSRRLDDLQAIWARLATRDFSRRRDVTKRRLEGAQDNHVDQVADLRIRRVGPALRHGRCRDGILQNRCSRTLRPFDPISPSVAAPPIDVGSAWHTRSVDLCADDGMSDAHGVADPPAVNLARW